MMYPVLWTISPVAPPAGAWIETGAKQSEVFCNPVAPPAGAWIETDKTLSVFALTNVAPPAGAWIETILSTVRLLF